MKINSVTVNANQGLKLENQNKNNNYYTNYLSENNQNPSFSGLGSSFKNISTGIFKFIDNSSFFVEFLIIDTLSMLVPRVFVGLNRDKEQLGHLNYKAGAEEFGREAFSGPGMNLIPMAALALASAAKPASKMEKSTLEGLNAAMKNVLKNSNDTNYAKDLAEQVFENVFANSKANVSKADKEAFIKILNKASEKLDKKDAKNAVQSFVKKVAEINNRISPEHAPLNPKNLNLGGKEINAAHLFEDFGAYTKDVVSKVSSLDKKQASKVLDRIARNRGALKMATAVTAFFGVGAFLKQLPKLYQQKGLSPAQESALRASGQLPAENSENKKTEPAFKGKGNLASKFSEFFKLDRSGTMARGLFITNAFVFLLGSRIFTSRDSDERRECIVRDIPTILISVKGVPVIGDIIGKMLQKKYGYAITQNKHVASYSQVQDWHTIDKNLTSGLKGFGERIDKLGGNMKKICSSLNPKLKDELKNYSSDNKTFMKEILQNEKLSDTITKILKNPENKAAKNAAFNKTITKMTGFGATLLAIGLLVPKLNIAITKAVHQNDNKAKQA